MSFSVSYRAKKDSQQEMMMTRLYHSNNMDELLRAQSRFFSVNDIIVSFLWLTLATYYPDLVTRVCFTQIRHPRFMKVMHLNLK